jgi:hypothetical protein
VQQPSHWPYIAANLAVRKYIIKETLLQSIAPGNDDDEKDVKVPKNPPVRTPKDAE